MRQECAARVQDQKGGGVGAGHVRIQGWRLLIPAPRHSKPQYEPPAPCPSDAAPRSGRSIPLPSQACPDPALLSMPSGICGFLTFGAAVDPDVLLSYPSEDMAVAVARAFIILSVLTSYPILHFCGR